MVAPPGTKLTHHACTHRHTKGPAMIATTHAVSSTKPAPNVSSSAQQAAKAGRTPSQVSRYQDTAIGL